MEYQFEPNKYQYLKVVGVVGDARPRNIKQDGILGRVPVQASNTDALGDDGWELIYFSENIISGTLYVFRREHDEKERKEWMISFYHENKSIPVMSKGKRMAYKYIKPKPEV